VFIGKAVFITGASSGIGAALAREFAHHGAELALAARRVDRLEALAAELRAHGRRVLVVRCDVTRDQDLVSASAATVAGLGRIDVVVANAGFGVVGPIDRLTLDDYRRQFETNVFGVLRTVLATRSELRRTRGRLVIVGSVSGHVALPGASPYAMSKFAVRALAQALDFELRPAGVSVTLVSPGFVETELHQVDNRGVRHPDVAPRAPAFVRTSAEHAARRIVRAVSRRRREVVITWLGHLTVRVQRYLPALFNWAVHTFGIRTRPDAAQAARRPRGEGPNT
jgi:short-subunit dehydrogenase